MSSRSIKRRAMRLFHGRFHGAFMWRSVEEQAWLDAPPVGREFGSPDFERITMLDRYSFGEIESGEVMRHLGIDTLEILHAQMFEAGIPIHTEAYYIAALREVSALIDLDPAADTSEGERLDVLGTLVQAYESKHYPIDPPDHINDGRM